MQTDVTQASNDDASFEVEYARSFSFLGSV